MSISTKSAKPGLQVHSSGRADSTGDQASALRRTNLTRMRDPRRKSPSSAHSSRGIRPAKVARAKVLISDPSYPGEKVLQAVAKRLARKWSKLSRR